MQLNERIGSIDALRGFDMLMIIFADQFFHALDKAANSSISSFFANQFEHPDWFGSTFYDIIMPLFLFVVGAVIPYSLSKFKKESEIDRSVYPKLIRRFCILFFLGWIVQGNLLKFDINEFHIFSNTLQAIAVGYLFSSLAFLYLSKNQRYYLFVFCLVIYTLLLTLPHLPTTGRSQILPDKNFAIYFDRMIFGRFDDGLQYSWLLTSFGFIGTTLSGLFAGEFIQSGKPSQKMALKLLLIGICGLALGIVLGIWHPIVKKIWTSTFVLASSGVCFILLSLFYYLIDVCKYQKWAFFLRVIGLNAIAAYVLSHVFSFSSISESVLFGLEKYIGPYYPVATSLGGFLILYALLRYFYQNKTFIKV